ncbi:ATP-dependent DNA helicase RecG [Candidatus Microgenomates bacterium]|nr:ATP-dependent DNA helicase RecG [Candidatus Microgenomates bacterium]
MNLQTPIEKLFMIGPTYAKRLKKLEINNLEDFLHHYPFRYDDYSIISKICFLQPGEKITIQGEVLSMKNVYTKSGKKIQQASIADETGKIDVVWFNQPFLIKSIRQGDKINLSGKIDWFGNKLVLISPEHEVVKITAPIHTARLVPIYPETRGVSSKWLRSRIAPLLKRSQEYLIEYLPEKIINQYNLLDFSQAIQQIHFPRNKTLAKKARERLAFDELFLIQLASLIRKAKWKKEIVGNKLKITDHQSQIQEFIKKLPFELTKAQRKCIGQILTDMGTSQPMNRLLQGDVGSGKTVVAMIAMYTAFLNDFQSILIAPTEILAFQHFETISKFLKPFNVKIALRTRSKKIANLESNIIIGTHALLSEKLKFNRVGLVIVDEQHRFGVEQRAILRNKGINPHLLTMTATPIPRTIALTLYGELDLSFIDEMPKGRKIIKTWMVPPEKRKAAYQWIKDRVKKNKEQAFIICPLIEESQIETMQSVKAATVEFKQLKEAVFSSLRLGLLHGKVKSKEKEKNLKDFRQRKIDILVATPVVEVGIDIPRATIMMIEAADRFGLAQLHQLRGRVGRSDLASFCLLFTETASEKALKRLKVMEKTHIGSQLAELDLKLRGPGEIYGARQHGFTSLKIASMTDFELIEKTRMAAKKVLKENPDLKKFSLLQRKLKKHTIKTISPD